MFGMAEGLLDFGDVAANAATFLAEAVAGVGPGWDNDLDMSGAFKDFMVNGVSPMNAPSFDPSTQRIDTDHMITRNATVQNNGSIQSAMGEDNAFRHGDRGEDYLRQIAAAAANQAAEIARMRRAFEESQ
jgi:hypothetical protein